MARELAVASLAIADFYEPLFQTDIARSDVSVRKLRKILFLAAYAMMLWSYAWAIIHFAGPGGLFTGALHVLLYAITIPVTMLTNLQSRRRVGLPKSQTLTAVAITSLVAMFTDSVVFGWFPWIYSTDSDVARAGAAWLLWAIAVALVLAVISATDTDATE